MCTMTAARLLLLSLVLSSASASVKTLISSLEQTIEKAIYKELVDITTPVEESVVSYVSKVCESLKKTLGVTYDELVGTDEPDMSNLTLVYRNTSTEEYEVYNLSTAPSEVIDSTYYNSSRKLYIFVHGYTDNPSKASFINISNALLESGESNVLALNSSSLIGNLYLRSSTYVRFIGQKLGETLVSFVDLGVKSASIELIGHSLGAHICSWAGKTFYNLTGEKLGRISGLDPAGPCFGDISSEIRLNSTDATLVDVLHSDGGVFGLADAIGQVDYYPNNGTEQPNCLIPGCSHSRSWLLYAESIVNSTSFPAIKCSSWEAFEEEQCDSDISYMGYPCQSGTTGTYYLQTSGVWPYTTGTKGMTYQEE